MKGLKLIVGLALILFVACIFAATDNKEAKPTETADKMDEFDEFEAQIPEPVIEKPEASLYTDLNSSNFNDTIKNRNITIIFYDEGTNFGGLNAIAKHNKGVIPQQFPFYKVDVVANSDLANDLNIEYIPTVFIFIEGVPIYEYYGDTDNFDELLAWFEGGYLSEYDPTSELDEGEIEDGEFEGEEEGDVATYYVNEGGEEVELDDMEAEEAVDAEGVANENIEANQSA